MKLKHTLFLLLTLPVVSACNQSDDVAEIFTGKTWKLTTIFYDSGTDVCLDYWNNNTDAYKKSTSLLNEPGNFIITFTGAEVERKVIGSYSGMAANSNIAGSWTADGVSNKFSVSGQGAPSGSEDILGKAFINGLINAYEYQGDTNGNLRIFFIDKERGNSKRVMLFHVR